MGRVVQSSLERLIINLKLLAVNTEVTGFLEEDEDGVLYLNETSDDFCESASDELKALVSEVSEDLNEWLITDSGHHDIPGREACIRHGFRFYKGEEDSFGPVTSVIGIANFRFVYG